MEIKRKRWLFIFLTVISILVASSKAAPAEKPAAPIIIKVGFFDLRMVKAYYPPPADQDLIRKKAEENFRKKLTEIESKVQRTMKDKKSAALFLVATSY